MKYVTTRGNLPQRLTLSAVLVLTVLLGATAPVSAATIFSDGFESYAAGTLPPQGGWTDFGGSQPVTVSTAQAHSGTRSMRLSEGTDTLGGQSTGYGSDVYRNFPGTPISGKVVNFSYWQFIENSVDSVALMYISTGSMPNNFQTGLDLRAGTLNGNNSGPNMFVVQDVADTPTLIAQQPVVKGRWVEYNMTIDLIANKFNMSYDGANILSGAQWDTTPGDGITFGGIDFWMQLGNANGVNAFVYYDDFSLVEVPEPSALVLAPLGLALLKLRRRSQASVNAPTQA